MNACSRRWSRTTTSTSTNSSTPSVIQISWPRANVLASGFGGQVGQVDAVDHRQAEAVERGDDRQQHRVGVRRDEPDHDVAADAERGQPAAVPDDVGGHGALDAEADRGVGADADDQAEDEQEQLGAASAAVREGGRRRSGAAWRSWRRPRCSRAGSSGRRRGRRGVGVARRRRRWPCSRPACAVRLGRAGCRCRCRLGDVDGVGRRASGSASGRPRAASVEPRRRSCGRRPGRRRGCRRGPARPGSRAAPRSVDVGLARRRGQRQTPGMSACTPR